MKKALLMLLGVFLFATASIAQEKTVTGRVVDGDGLILPGVSVKIKGTTTGVSTGTDGNYTIRVSSGQTLVFSFIGMMNKEQTVGSANVINVTLNSDTKSLNEVVITAFGITREKKAIGYATQTIQGSEIAQTQRENFINSLQGRVAGATITPSTGQPGASSQIILRGPVSLDGDNQPLFVVDGLPISNRTFSQGSLVSDRPNRDNDYSNRAMDINPEDIQSVTILKGPEAAALYGTDGSSGAIVITTKKAASGIGRATYNNSFRVESVYRFPEIQQVYGPGFSGVDDPETRSFFGPKFAAQAPLYDNIGNFFETGFTQKHNLTFEGGTPNLSVRASGAIDDQTGVMPGTGFQRLNFRVSGTSKIGSKISITSSLNLINSRIDKTYKGAGSPMQSTLTWPSNDDMSVYLTPEGNRRQIDPTNTLEIDNPYWGVEKNPNNDKTNRFLGNFSISYDPFPWLGFVARMGSDIYSTIGNSLYHPQSRFGIASRGLIENFTENSQLLNGNFITTLKKDYGKFSPVLRLGYSIDDSRYETNAVRGEKFYKADFNSLNNTDPTTQRFKNSNPLKRRVGWFGNAELGYDRFLYLTLTGRMDGSSTLPAENRYFFYPASSLSFVFSELKPFADSEVLSLGKFRASWGLTGKDARTPYITSSTLVPQGTTGGGFALGFFGGNSALQAEFTEAVEVGTELNFFKDRIGLDFTFYQSTSDKQITAPRLSYGTGFVLKYINGGVVRNRGFELQLKGTPVQTSNFAWDIVSNFSRNRGKILEMPAELPTFYLSDTWLYAGVRAQYTKGSSITSLGANSFLRNDKGQLLINPSTGLPIRDGNYKQIADRAPDLNVGLSNSFTYKNLNLSFLLDMRKGGDIFNGNELYLYVNGLSKLTLDRETPRVLNGILRDGLENSNTPTQNNIVVTPYLQNAYYSSSYSEEDFIEKDVNWIRLKDITLSYNLPTKLLSRTKFISRANVFVTGTDVFLFTNYKGADPTVSGLNASAGGFGGSGIDYGSLALPRGMNFGLKLGF